MTLVVATNPGSGGSGMKRILALTLTTVLLAACSSSLTLPAGDAEIEAFVTQADASGRFSAHMTGAQEVPPNDSRAQGQANFRLADDGLALHYRLIVANIENVTQVHIHNAPAGANGPVVAWLYPDGPPAQLIPGRTGGVLATGTITADDLVGPMAGKSLSILIDELRAGNAYVNVHTSQFPPGEIRGQIR
jgi:hypothetical protein